MRHEKKSRPAAGRTTGRTALVAAAAALTVAAVASAPSGHTEAQWREQARLAAPDGSTGPFASDAVKVSSTVGDVDNDPGLLLTSEAAANTQWIDVRSSTVTALPAGDTAAMQLLSSVSLDYTVVPGSGSCAQAGTPYWHVADAGGLRNGVTVTRPATPKTSFTVQPGGSTLVCVAVAPTQDTRPGPGRKAFFLANAGRALQVTTTLRTRSLPPATWASSEHAVTSTYRTRLPPPTDPADGSVCTVGPNGRAVLHWAWPTAQDDSATSNNSTKAVNRWTIMREAPDGSGWQLFRDGINPNWRSQSNGDGISAAQVNNDGGSGPRRFLLRLHPFAGSSAWVDSTWIVTLTAVNGRAECTAVEPNPDPGPVGLP